MQRVVYLDPLWAVTERGAIDPTRAVFEREVFGSEFAIDFGIYEDGGYVREGARVEALVSGADALVISRAQVTPAIVRALAPSCKVVGRAGIGFDNLNAPLLAQAHIFGFNVPDYCIDEVSSHALAFVLALERRIAEQDARIKNGVWDTYAGVSPRRMSALAFGIVGFGNIGRATARKAQALFGSVIAYDPYVHADLMAGLGVAKCATLAELMGRADAVSVHAYLDAGSRRLIDARALEHVRPGTLLVNTARGEIVDPPAVLAALRDGRLGGYGSDVFAPEDPQVDPVNAEILACANVLVTPHVAFRSVEAERSQRVRVAETVRDVLLTGAPPEFGRRA